MGGRNLRGAIAEKLASGQLRVIEGGAGAPLLSQELTPIGRRSPDALRPDLIAVTNAAQVWAVSSTNSDLSRARDITRDKLRVVRDFIVYLDADILDATPMD